MNCAHCQKKIAVKKIALITYADGTQKTSNAPVVITTLDGTELPVHGKCKILYFAERAKQLLQPPTLPDDFGAMNIEDIVPIVLQAYETLNIDPLFQKVELALIKEVHKNIHYELPDAVIKAYLKRGISERDIFVRGLHSSLNVDAMQDLLEQQKTQQEIQTQLLNIMTRLKHLKSQEKTEQVKAELIESHAQFLQLQERISTIDQRHAKIKEERAQQQTAYEQDLQHMRTNVHCVDVDLKTFKWQVLKNPTPHRQQIFKKFLTDLDKIMLKKITAMFILE